MRDLGLGAYRFSVSWSRLYPEGIGSLNPAGIDYYRRLVEGLAENNILPFLTLYHWDLPQGLQDSGGWGNKDTIDAFARYTETVVGAFGDLVGDWITINEPSLHATVGHAHGRHAPGITDWRHSLQVGHNLLLAHGRAVGIIRGAGNHRVGFSHAFEPAVPTSQASEDAEAASRFDAFLNAWYLDPIFLGRYPTDLWDWFAARDLAPYVGESDLAVISSPIDFLGLNYYHPREIGWSRSWPLEAQEIPAQGHTTAMGWAIDPDSFYDVMIRAAKYRPERIFVTENGAAFDDELVEGRRVNDGERIGFLTSHLEAVQRAIRDGSPVEAYFVWSLLDNFQWDDGYSKRFGIVYVDFQTQERIIKDSGYFLRDVIALP